MTTPVSKCLRCQGSGLINYYDNDGYSQEPCDCTVPIEVKA